MKVVKEMYNQTDYAKVKERGRQEKSAFMKRWHVETYSVAEFNECSLHEVEVQLKDMKKEQIPPFLKKELGQYYEVLEMEDNYVRFYCFLDASFDPAEIDVVLYEMFGDYELGVYKSFHIG